MSAIPEKPQPRTEAEYLRLERSSEIKHEFFGGEVVAMTGASVVHNLIVGSTLTSLDNQLRGGPCRVFPSGLKVRTPGSGSYVYPDISVLCGEPQLADDQRDVLLNPTVIIEVLSPSTERYDRGRKFQVYRELPSLQEYVLIAQDSPHIERFVHQAEGFWQFNEARGLDASLALPSIGNPLALADVYEQVTFGAEGEPSEDD